MALISNFVSEISLPANSLRKNIAGNLTWQGNEFLQPGCDKEDVWIKAVPHGHNYRIANEALGLLLGAAINVPVIKKAAIIKVHSDSVGSKFLKENGYDPFVWVGQNMGKTLTADSTKQRVFELAHTEAGVRSLLINTLLDNWDQITLVTSDEKTVHMIDFDKSFNASHWTILGKIERSTRSNWIAVFSSIGRPALDIFNQYSQGGINDLEKSFSSVDEEFSQVAECLGIRKKAQRMVIDSLRSDIETLQSFCSKAIQEHSYFSESGVRN